MQKLNHWESLRGLAAMTVLFGHFFSTFYPALGNADIKFIHTKNAIELFIAKSPLNILYSGNFGVCIFFILSGYVLNCRYVLFAYASFLLFNNN